MLQAYIMSRKRTKCLRHISRITVCPCDRSPFDHKPKQQARGTIMPACMTEL
jgi:hypothetical protein